MFNRNATLLQNIARTLLRDFNFECLLATPDQDVELYSTQDGQHLVKFVRLKCATGLMDVVSHALGIDPTGYVFELQLSCGAQPSRYNDCSSTLNSGESYDPQWVVTKFLEHIAQVSPKKLLKSQD